ncbi:MULTISPECIES: 3-ketoacyl-ACP reductase [unclassified Clostridium]|uniref:3-ketoacyl-ACP reductase n=1 Tax=unclassified Clostridium TaxID=2614128 RepID=UPI001105DA3C|nr:MULTISPECIES: 3-ketoacyl-ACP reductase [unclassified Clostridium]
MKTALVTGGSRGIGLAIARELGVNGYQVAVMATRHESCYPESTRLLRDAGVSYAWFAGDIGRSEDRIRVVRETAERFGEIHVLVNNAGVAPKVRADLLEMTEESFDYVMETNTKGNMFMTQAAALQMMRQPLYGGKRGTIVNISSCSSRVSSVNRGEYCVSKAGISMLTQLYADRLAPEGIFVYEIRPGVIRTDMTSQVEEKYTELISQGMFPIARWGTPEDVAKAVRAFCSDDFCYTTGNYIDVDGGFHIRRL